MKNKTHRLLSSLLVFLLRLPICVPLLPHLRPLRALLHAHQEAVDVLIRFIKHVVHCRCIN